ncbi:hypothetical protein NXS98_07605 [Fontisphaera persica]|uniref:hypothetical protein n=1 Tax=Fontisphaera persica TaxID=2974023 RepID=UPI0024BF471C|nr:hypothetical protein [Fontisphaera persica]WCJ60975.1 hypothetical protein NXS98_07605 [Fontisphaera persica]
MVPWPTLWFGYDWMERRVSKVVSNRVNGVWQLQRRWKYVYDGWNMIAEVEEVTGEVRTHVWGWICRGRRTGRGRGWFGGDGDTQRPGCRGVFSGV